VNNLFKVGIILLISNYVDTLQKRQTVELERVRRSLLVGVTHNFSCNMWRARRGSLRKYVRRTRPRRRRGGGAIVRRLAALPTRAAVCEVDRLPQKGIGAGKDGEEEKRREKNCRLQERISHRYHHLRGSRVRMLTCALTQHSGCSPPVVVVVVVTAEAPPN